MHRLPPTNCPEYASARHQRLTRSAQARTDLTINLLLAAIPVVLLAICIAEFFHAYPL
jgi:hypothetical protein